MVYIADMADVGSRLRELREKSRLTLGQVGEYEHLSAQYLSRLERGINDPGVWDLLARLAKRYHTSTDYLLGLTDDARPSAIARAAVDGVSEERALYVAVNPVVQALLDTVAGLNEWRQRELVFIARGMSAAQEAEVAEDPAGVAEGMEALFDYVEGAYGADLANRLEDAMSLLLCADEPTLRRLADFLESIGQGDGDTQV